MESERADAAAATATIYGYVFRDRNDNGEWNANERSFGGRVVFADVNGNGMRDRGEAFAKSDASGYYEIANAPTGSYDILAVVKDGWHATWPITPGYGYAAANADYRFVNIADPANLLTFADRNDGSTVFEPGHELIYFGEGYQSLAVSTNGFAAIIDYAVGTPTGHVPDTAYPNGVIAPLWADFTLGANGAVYAFDDAANKRVIIEWKNVALASDPTGPTSTFEMIYGYNGSIRFSYQTVAPGVSGAVGVENLEGDRGTSILTSGAPASGTSYLFTIAADRVGVAHVTNLREGAFIQIDFGQAKGTAQVSPDAFGADRSADDHHAIAAVTHPMIDPLAVMIA